MSTTTHTLTASASGFRHNGDPTCPACVARREAGIRAAQDNLGWLASSGTITVSDGDRASR